MFKELENFKKSASPVEADNFDGENSIRLPCFLSNKNGNICAYELDITASHLSIISPSNQKIKCTLLTRRTHVRKVSTVPRNRNALKNEDEGIWYPIKFALADNKFRTVFTESEEHRLQIISDILSVQGFHSALD